MMLFSVAPSRGSLANHEFIILFFKINLVSLLEYIRSSVPTPRVSVFFLLDGNNGILIFSGQWTLKS